MSKKIYYDIDIPCELAAGIVGGIEQIIIDIESGDPGGEEGEFEQHMRNALVEWYDGAKVTAL